MPNPRHGTKQLADSQCLLPEQRSKTSIRFLYNSLFYQLSGISLLLEFFSGSYGCHRLDSPGHPETLAVGKKHLSFCLSDCIFFLRLLSPFLFLDFKLSESPAGSQFGSFVANSALFSHKSPHSALLCFLIWLNLSGILSTLFGEKDFFLFGWVRRKLSLHF
jgi:hypothetical protein